MYSCILVVTLFLVDVFVYIGSDVFFVDVFVYIGSYVIFGGCIRVYW